MRLVGLLATSIPPIFIRIMAIACFGAYAFNTPTNADTVRTTPRPMLVVGRHHPFSIVNGENETQKLGGFNLYPRPIGVLPGSVHVFVNATTAHELLEAPALISFLDPESASSVDLQPFSLVRLFTVSANEDVTPFKLIYNAHRFFMRRWRNFSTTESIE